jgi:hypothetical protein
MTKRLLAVLALVAAGALACTLPALTQEGEVTSHELGSMGGAKPGDKRVVKPSKDGSYTLSKKSVAARTALCKADCRPNNYKDCGTWGCVGMHGLYRSYNRDDPQLKTPQGQKAFAQCVATCLAPLPPVYIQRAVFKLGFSWFGKSKEGCLDCHVSGH